MQTQNFSIKYLMQNVLSPEVYINEAFQVIDAILPRVVKSVVDIITQTSEDGDVYLYSSSGQKPNNIALFLKNKGWVFFEPKIGWNIYVVDLQKFLYFNGNNWQEMVLSSNTTSFSVGDYKNSAQNVDHGLWLLCDGRAVSRSQYNNLFQVIGTAFGGGDGSTTFNLPNPKGMVCGVVGQGDGTSNRSLGQKVGDETHALTEGELPPHAHGISWEATANRGYAYDATGGMWRDGAQGKFTYTDTVGLGYPFNIMQPTLFVGNLFIHT